MKELSMYVLGTGWVVTMIAMTIAYVETVRSLNEDEKKSRKG